MAKITFKAVEKDGCRDGTYGWTVLVDGYVVVEHIRSGDTDVAAGQLNDVWKAAGIDMQFDWE